MSISIDYIKINKFIGDALDEGDRGKAEMIYTALESAGSSEEEIFERIQLVRPNISRKTWDLLRGKREEKPEPEALTVAELIAKLQRCKPTAKVQTEGCDCYGDAVDVDGGPNDDDVLITRERVNK